jgi:signal peptidase II
MESPQPIISEKRYDPGGMLKFLKNHLFDYIILLIISGTIVAADQWTKALVRANIPLGTDWLPKGLMWLMPFARIRHWYNSGAAFGIFRNGNMVFTILAIIIILLILYYFPRTERNDWWLRVAMSLQLAGAAGNLLDRLAFTRVTDFISVGNFAIFNVADASISTGVVVLLFGVWLKERAEKRQAARVAAPETGQNVPTEDEAKRG